MHKCMELCIMYVYVHKKVSASQLYRMSRQTEKIAVPNSS